MLRPSTVPIALLLALALAGCDEGTGASGAVSFRGTIAGANESGVIEVTAASPVTGTLTIVGGPVINLTGDFNSESGQFTASGGGYSLTATFSNGTLSGTYTGPNGSGTISALPSDQVTVQVFCGTASGTSPGGSVSAVWNLVRSGNTVAGVAVEDLSSASPGETTVLSGTISGTSISLSYEGGSASGTLTGESISGTWTTVEGASGTWMGSTAACASG